MSIGITHSDRRIDPICLWRMNDLKHLWNILKGISITACNHSKFFFFLKKYKSFPYYIDFKEFAIVTKLCMKKKKTTVRHFYGCQSNLKIWASCFKKYCFFCGTSHVHVCFNTVLAFLLRETLLGGYSQVWQIVF